MEFKRWWAGFQIKTVLLWELVKEIVKAPFASKTPVVEVHNPVPKWGQPLSSDDVLRLYAENEKEIEPIWNALAMTNPSATMRMAVEEWLRRKLEKPTWGKT